MRRIGKVINEIKVILQKVDPETVPFRWLTNLEKAFQEHNFESQMHGFVDTGEISYLNDVNQTIADKVLEPLYHLKSHYKVTAKESPLRGLEVLCDTLASRIEDLSANFEGEIGQYSQRLEALESSTAELVNLVDSAKGQINNALSGMESRFTEGETQRSKEFSSNQNTRKDEFAADQRKRKTQFSDWFKNFRSTTNSQLKDFADDNINEVASSKDQINKALSIIEKGAEQTLKRIKDLYEFTGDVTLSGEHLKAARNDQRIAYGWSFLVFVFIGITLWWGHYAYVNGSNYIADVPTMTFQLIRTTSVTFVLLFGALFFARQAASHSQSSKRTRWLGLQIHAINPYVNEFEPQKRGDFKDRIGDKLFGVHPEDAARISKADRLPSGRFKKFLEAITNSQKD